MTNTHVLRAPVQAIAMLERFKSSSDTREQEIFACMVHNLFDEYRFFHNYPEKELRITGILFGSLIQHQLVSSITLGIALRYVLEALRRAPGPDAAGKMFRFGMFALEQFKGRLGEWPQYCSHIVQIPHLVGNHPALVEEIERSMQRQGGNGGAAGGTGAGGGAAAPAAEVGAVAAALGQIVAAAAPSNLAESVNATSVGGPIGRPPHQGEEGHGQSQMLGARTKAAGEGAIGESSASSVIGGGQQGQQQRLPPGPSTPGGGGAAGAPVARSPGAEQRTGGDPHQLLGQGASHGGMGGLGVGVGGGGVGGLGMGLGGQSQAGGGGLGQIGGGQRGGPSAMQQMSQQQAQAQAQAQQQGQSTVPGGGAANAAGSSPFRVAPAPGGASTAPGSQLGGSSSAAGKDGGGSGGLGLGGSLAFGGLGQQPSGLGQAATGAIGGGVAAGAPGHETWGSSAAGPGLPQGGGAGGAGALAVAAAAAGLPPAENGTAAPAPKKGRGGAIPVRGM